MRVFIFMLCVLSVLSTVAYAQKRPDQGWPITKRCVGELPRPLPREQWTFDGIIFNRNHDGVRAIRTNINTSYYLAFDGDDSFAFDGAFSPDGKWFAYPAGSTSYASMLSDLTAVKEVRIVNTTTSKVEYQIPWNIVRLSGSIRGLGAIYWLDNEHFAYELNEKGGGAIANPFAGEIVPWDNEVLFTYLFNFSPDFTRATHYMDGDLGAQLYDVENDTFLKPLADDEFGRTQRLIWLVDTSGYVAETRQEQESGDIEGGLVYFDRDGGFIEWISPDMFPYEMTFSRDGSKLAFIEEDHHLFVVQWETKQIIDFCFDLGSNHGRTVVWSPDGQWLAVDYENRPLLLNTETLEIQILSYEVDEILGWYPRD